MFLLSSTLIGSQVFKLVYKTNKNMYSLPSVSLYSFLLAKNLQFPQVQHLSIELSAWKMKKKLCDFFFFLLSHYIITRYNTHRKSELFLLHCTGQIPRLHASMNL